MLPANDNVNQYVGMVDYTTPTLVNSNCVTVNFNKVPDFNTSIPYYRLPLTVTQRSNVRPTYPQFPAYSYIFIPVAATPVHSVLGQNHFADFPTMLANSPFNMDTTTDGKGIVFSRNKLGGFDFILRKAYLVDSGPTSPITGFEDSCPDGKEVIYRNCGIVNGKLLNNEIYTGPRDHFFSEFKLNFNLWIMVVLSLVYFIWALGTSVHDPLNPHYENNSWFNHPLYSIWVYGNPRQTKVARLTLLLMSITSYWLASALFNWVFRWNVDWKRALISALIGVVFSWIVTRIFGYILKGLNNVHHKFLDDIKKCDNFEAKERVTDEYENSKLTWNYLYYSLAFAYFAGTGFGTIGINIFFDNERFWWMMLSFGICIVSEWFFFDFIAVIFGKGNGCLAKWIQVRGYYIDYELHKNYDQYVSDED